MRIYLVLCILSCMAFSHAAFCQSAQLNNRFVLHAKKQPRKKLVFAHVAGLTNGAIKKDSLLKVGTVSMSDLRHKLKNIKVVSFALVAERNNGGDKWTVLRKATVYSMYDGNHFTNEMQDIIRHCGKGDRIEIFVTGIYYDGITFGSPVNGIGYGARVCLCME